MIQKLDEIKQIISEAEAILITAGAGMGVDSGLPDFRGNEGFWNAYPIAKKLNLGFQDLANPIWFITNPPMAWAFYGHRYNLYKNTIPHEGFKILLNLVKEKEDYFVFTSNVDGQFQKAGFDKDKIIECHGSIHHIQCLNNCSNVIFNLDKDIIEIDETKLEAIEYPKCEKCGDTARTNILMFGDWEWNTKRTDKQEAKYSLFLKELKYKKFVIIEIGAGKDISTVRTEGQNIAKHYDGKLIRINPRDFEVEKSYGYSIPFGGLKGIKKIIKPKKY